jgi:hypothetical protein
MKIQSQARFPKAYSSSPIGAKIGYDVNWLCKVADPRKISTCLANYCIGCGYKLYSVPS